MKKQKRLIVGVIIIAILLMGIGYAALANTTLTISGTAEATASQENFKVYFTGENTIKNPNTTDVSVTVNNGEQNATVNMTGLTAKGDTAYAILEIINDSNDVNAESINVTSSQTDTEFFDIEAVMCESDGTPIEDYSVASGNKTYVKVSATLLQTPTEDVNTSINITITAVPEANS